MGRATYISWRNRRTEEHLAHDNDPPFVMQWPRHDVCRVCGCSIPAGSQVMAHRVREGVSCLLCGFWRAGERP